MVNTIVNYFQQKAATLDFLSYAYGLAEIVDRQDGEENKSFPAVWSKGSLTQVSFDAFPSFVFFTLDGGIERDTDDGETSCEDNVTEVYKFKAYLFVTGEEVSECSSFTQKSAYVIAKTLSTNEKQLAETLNFENATITITDFEFRKKEVWNELHNNIPYCLGERQQLCSIGIRVELQGVESCFAVDPCSDDEFVYICPQRNDDMQIDQFTTVANQTAYTRPVLENRTVWIAVDDNVVLKPSQFSKPYASSVFTLLDNSFPVDAGHTITIFYTRT